MKSNTTKVLLVALTLWTCVQNSEAGRLRRLLYPNYDGSVIANLYAPNMNGEQKFPDSPDGVDYMPPETGGPATVTPPFFAQSPIDSNDRYGSYIRGYLTAPETGNYMFWLSSDDESRFSMTTDSSDPLNTSKTNLLCYVPGWSGIREWAKYPSQQSAPVALVKGTTYYLEILHKEGTGGDHVILGWQTPSGLLERPMPAWHLQPVRDTRWSEPDLEVVLGPVAPTGGDTAIYDGNRVAIYANVNLNPPVTYQWLKNGNPVAGATDAYYLFRARTADNNSSWTVQATSGGTTYTSDPVVLTVYGDIIPPFIESAGPPAQNYAEVQVVFSEDVLPSTATNLANYTLTGTTIQSATLGPDNRTVTLDTGLLPPTHAYTLTVNNVTDMANPANTMTAASFNFLLSEGSETFRIYSPTLPATGDLAGLRAATSNNTSNVRYKNEDFVTEYLITTNRYGWNIVPLRDNYTGQMIGYLTPPETGNYRFLVASDDQSIVYLGTNELRSSKREIASYNGSTGQWTTSGSGATMSGNIALEAGKRYYIEVVYRDGTGGDGFTLFWQTPSSGPIPSGTTQTETQDYIVPIQYMSPYKTYGPVTLKTNLPAMVTASAGTRVTLSVTADGLLPYTYQWFKGDALIPGATANSYTLPFLQAADNNTTYYVVVNNNFSSVTSVVATVMVLADTNKPMVLTAGSVLKQQIDIQFSEPVTAASAENLANYSLADSKGAAVAISSAVLNTNDPTRVTLRTAVMPETDLLQLTIHDVTDASGAALVMDSVTKSVRAHNFDTIARVNNSQNWSVTADDDRLYITAGGNDIWSTSDQMVYAYKSVTGNFDYRVQAPTALPAVNQWVKMGIMARSTADAGARNAFIAFTPPTPAQNTYTPQIRDTTAGSSTSSDVAGTLLNGGLQAGIAARPTVVYPSWVRLQRIGDTFYYYLSNDGTNWTLWTYYDSTMSTEGQMPSTLLLGLAMTSHDTSRTADGVMASFTAIPNQALGISLQPTNYTVVEGQNATFRVTAVGNSPYWYQWLKNGQPIQDATNSVLTLTRVPYSDNAASISVRITNPLNQTVTSQNATLTVLQDTGRPTVAYWVMPKVSLDATQVKLLYSEPMDRASAETAGSYQITANASGTPLTVSSAMLDVDERTVTLTTAQQTAGTLYKVVVNNVTDQACCPPNAVAPNSTDYFYYAGTSGKFAQRSDGFIIMEAENATRIESAADGDLWQKRTTEAGYSGSGYMVVPNGSGGGSASGSGGIGTGTGSRLEFDIVFSRPATNYTLWVRGWNQDHTSSTTAGNDDSIYVGLDGNLVSLGATGSDAGSSQMQSWGYTGWDWRSDRASAPDPLVLTNVAPGVHTLIIWHREDGTLIDKIVLEPGVRSTSNTAEPAPALSNGGLGDPETWEWQVPPPSAPTITITNPTNTQRFANGADLNLETSIVGPTPAARVEFYNVGVLVGSNTVAPFNLALPGTPEGIYNFSARVTDVLGYQVTSPTVQVVVDSTKPVAYAVGSLRGNGIGVYFRDTTSLDATTATDPANYTVNAGALAVTNATLEPDGHAVMLALNAPVTGSFSVDVKNVKDTGFGPNTMDAVTLQSSVVDWPDQDIGTPDAANPGRFTDPIRVGYAQAIGTDGFYVRAGGSDIWNTADGMHFVYREITGDFDVSTRVQSLDRPNEWAKSSVMVREDLDGTSRNMMALVAPPPIGSPAGMNLFNAQIRDTKGGTTVSLGTSLRPTPVPYPDAWLRLTRTNQSFVFSWRTNTTMAWTAIWTTNMPSSAPYPDKVYVGLATTSHSNTDSPNNMATAYYREVTGFTPAAVIVSPTLAAQVTPAGLVLSWTSTDSSFGVQSTATLLPNSWQSLNLTPTVSGNNYSVTVPVTGNAQFFRLSR